MKKEARHQGKILRSSASFFHGCLTLLCLSSQIAASPFFFVFSPSALPQPLSLRLFFFGSPVRRRTSLCPLFKSKNRPVFSSREGEDGTLLWKSRQSFFSLRFLLLLFFVVHLFAVLLADVLLAFCLSFSTERKEKETVERTKGRRNLVRRLLFFLSVVLPVHRT